MTEVIICPICATQISDEGEHIWWYLGREYCSQRCAELAAGVRRGR